MSVTVIKGDKAHFLAEVGKVDKAIVDFHATWCGPCRMIAPKVEEFAQKFGAITFFKVDVDENPEISEHNGIQAMPTFIFFNKGARLDGNDWTIQGASEQKIKANLEKLNDL